MVKSVFDISIDFKKSTGSYVYDRKSKVFFLDLFSMFSSLPIGYNHPIFDAHYDEKIKYISHLRMCNNLFHSIELSEFEKKFKKFSFHKNLHFCTTGALAVEAALKCSFEYKKSPDSLVLGLKNSFHGINSWGFITDAEIPSVYNRMLNFPKNNWHNLDIDELINYVEKNSSNISSVIIEPIQCTAGDIYIDISKIKILQLLCASKNICFIVDEIQTGFGVTGENWYSQKIGIQPDIIIFGKKSQICGVMVNDKYSEAINSQYRKLEVTFDGDLIDAIRAGYILDEINQNSLLENVAKKSLMFKNELSSTFDNYRSEGHLIAFDFNNKQERDKFVNNAYSNQLLVNPTAELSVRLRPNLAFSDNEFDDFICKIKKIRN